MDELRYDLPGAEIFLYENFFSEAGDLEILKAKIETVDIVEVKKLLEIKERLHKRENSTLKLKLRTLTSGLYDLQNNGHFYPFPLEAIYRSIYTYSFNNTFAVYPASNKCLNLLGDATDGTFKKAL